MGFEDRPYYREGRGSTGSPLSWIVSGSVYLFTAFGISVRAHASLILTIAWVLLFGFGQGFTWQDRVQSMMILFVIVLAWGLARAHAVPAWSALCIAVAAVLFAISGPTASSPMQLIAAAVLLVGLGAIGWMVLSETDDQWEHTPEVHGFRPAAGTS